jgi:hypothetical protein
LTGCHHRAADAADRGELLRRDLGTDAALVADRCGTRQRRTGVQVRRFRSHAAGYDPHHDTGREDLAAAREWSNVNYRRQAILLAWLAAMKTLALSYHRRGRRFVRRM